MPETGTRSMRGYVLGDVLGEGAFGTVYRSTQPGVGREVAIKVIRAEFADDPAFVRRFEAEAQLVAHLEHPHIVPLYDFWREPGGAYLVFRLLRGGTAEQRARRDGPWELDRVNRLVTEIGGALVAAHAAGVVHRDVKPANVLFDEAGNAYLADFGIAAVGRRGPTRRRLRTGSHRRDRRCMRRPSSSEARRAVAAGRPVQLRRDDLGAARRRAAVRRRNRVDASCRQARAAGRSLRIHRPDVPREIDVVLQRATASRPEDRYGDMSALLAAWQSAAARRRGHHRRTRRRAACAAQAETFVDRRARSPTK